jgi:hypothetical protein
VSCAARAHAPRGCRAGGQSRSAAVAPRARRNGGGRDSSPDGARAFGGSRRAPPAFCCFRDQISRRPPLRTRRRTHARRAPALRAAARTAPDETFPSAALRRARFLRPPTMDDSGAGQARRAREAGCAASRARAHPRCTHASRHAGGARRASASVTPRLPPLSRSALLVLCSPSAQDAAELAPTQSPPAHAGAPPASVAVRCGAAAPRGATPPRRRARPTTRR